MSPRAPKPAAPRRAHGALGLAFLLAMLAGCVGESEDLQTWMERQRSQVTPTVQPLVPPKRFEPQPYAQSESVEPFSNQKLAVVIKQEARQPNSLLSTELNRRKEPLEAYPLDSMSMVGSVTKQGVPYALLRVEALLYQIKVGDHLGQNYGRVTRISETEIVLREVIQDAGGEWIERPATLQLQERAR